MEVVRLVDGDKLEVRTDGVFKYALSFNDVYLERNKACMDRYGFELPYIWFEVGNQPYLLNEVFERSGWALDVDCDDRLKKNEF